MSVLKNKTRLLTGIVIAVALAFAGAKFNAFELNLYSKDANADTAKPAAAPQALPVIVTIVQPEPIQIWKEFSARMIAVDFAEIRPQVSGNIVQILFEDGQEVKQGDVLFVIDPRPFEATLNQIEAELSAAQNEATYTRKILERAKELIKNEAISQRLYDDRENAYQIAKTSVAAAKARLMQAQINLDHAYVKAPISGRISRAEITVGNLVATDANAPLLTTIVSSEGIYADFDVDEQTYLADIRSVAKNKTAENKIPVILTLSDHTQEYAGFIHSFDNRINTASGTIRGRAYFANKDGALLPGMFSKIKIGSAIIEEHILVNEKAISTNQDRKFVYIVNEENKVAYRQVSIGNSVAGKRIITSGLKTGDRVIVEGISRIRPDMLVEAKIKSTAQASQADSDL